MKTKKTILSTVLIMALLITFSGISQENENDYKMAEIIYIKAKVGMEKAFVNAITGHNAKYHKDGKHKASLDNILTGKEAGWFVWIMGPCTFTDLDNRPSGAAHDEHWAKTVAPNVLKYGRTEYWRFNDKLSFVVNENTPKYETIWFIDLKRGDYYRFKSFMSKIKEAHKKKNNDNIMVYNNRFNAGDGRDVAIVWGFNKWAELDDDDGGIKKTYEEINGEGSWENAMDEWTEITEKINSQVWEIGVK